MYKTYIKDKHSLVDLARYGSKSRKNIHSDVLIGEHQPFPVFKEGDILDANATLNLVNCINNQKNIFNTLSEKMENLENQVTESTNQNSSAIQQVSRKHERDMEYLKDYIDDGIRKHTVQLVYNDLEENLIIIK